MDFRIIEGLGAVAYALRVRTVTVYPPKDNYSSDYPAYWCQFGGSSSLRRYRMWLFL